MLLNYFFFSLKTGSVPDISRFILPLCLIKIKQAIKAAHDVKIIEPLISHVAKGNTAEATREPAETRFDKKTVIKNTVNDIMQANGEIIKKHQVAVATPFPPSLNFIKHG